MHLRAYTRRGTRYKLSAYFNAAVQAIGTHKERETAPECGHTCKRILGANRTCPTRKMSVCSMLHPIYKYFFFSRSYSFILFQSRCCLCVCVCGLWLCVSRIRFLLLFLVKIKRRFYVPRLYFSVDAFFRLLPALVGAASFCCSTRKWETFEKNHELFVVQFFFSSLLRSSFIRFVCVCVCGAQPNSNIFS